jgi:WD40 repeat protein
MVMASLSVSRQGLVQVKQAIAQKGWKVSDPRWLLEASRILEPQTDWNEFGPYAYGCSPQTWERFLQRTAIRDRSFTAFCQVLQLDPATVVQTSRGIKEDWREAPELSSFYGRQQELATLEQWIVKERSQLVSVVGFAGIGKTDLSLQCIHQIRDKFAGIIWRRLLNAPPPEVILSEWIKFLSEDQDPNLATTLDDLISQLLCCLQQRHYLLILDNTESILQDGETAYRPGYEAYGTLLKQVGSVAHQSCLLMTSRIKPQEVCEMEATRQVRSLELSGLDQSSIQAIFQDVTLFYKTNFQGSEQAWNALVAFYSGNPLALEVVARHILKQFNGDLSQFLQQDLRVFGKIRDLLDWHFDRLSDAEQEVLYWLTIHRTAVSIAALRESILLPLHRKQITETLDTLEQRLPLERNQDQLTLQPVLMEYMGDRLIQQICHELQSGQLQDFNRYALVQATARDYIQAIQIRLILNPIIEYITSTLGLDTQTPLAARMAQILASLKHTHQHRPGYAAGNLINLMRYGKLDLNGCDFSGLSIWQANLQGIDLHQVDFTACEFAQSSFTQNFAGIHAMAFSPARSLLALGDSNGDILLFDTRSQQLQLRLTSDRKNLWITSLNFSADGQQLVSGGFDCTVRLWDTQTGKCLSIFTHPKWVWSVALSPDGQTIASSGDDPLIRLWHLPTGTCQVLEGHTAWVWSVAFSPDGTRLASGGCDQTIRLWHLETQRCVSVLQGHDHHIWSIAFHPDGNMLASGGFDCTVKLWNLDTGECWKTLLGHTDVLRSVAFSADGQLLASGSFDDTVRVWCGSTGEHLKTLRGHLNGIHAVVFTDNHLLASGDNAQIFKLWNADTGECLKTLKGHNNWIWAIAMSPDGRLLASGNLDRTIRLWHLQTGTLIQTLRGHRDWVWSVAFSPDGQTLASCSDDETVKLWDIQTGVCHTTLQSPLQRATWTVAFSPDGQLLASGGRDGKVQLWEMATGSLRQCLAAHSAEHWVWSVTFSPDGQILASGSDDQTIKLWEVSTGNCCLSIPDPESKVQAIAFHPNGQQLVSGGDDRQVKLWDCATGELIQTFAGHTDAVLAVLFHPDGERIVSAGTDATIRIWQVQTGRCIQVLQGHRTCVRGLAFTPDGQMLATGSTDNTLRLWDICTGQALKNLYLQRPYEGMKIANAKGLTAVQEDTLITLGAMQ